VRLPGQGDDDHVDLCALGEYEQVVDFAADGHALDLRRSFRAGFEKNARNAKQGIVVLQPCQGLLDLSEGPDEYDFPAQQRAAFGQSHPGVHEHQAAEDERSIRE
jgi:hypothetical protein